MQNSKEIILFFGSYNPVHVGHLAIANYIVECFNFREFWFVVTPQNPLKKNSSLLDERQRKYMLELAIGDYKKFYVSDIEFYLPKPNYTIKTLTYLQEKYPNTKFSILVGGDNLKSFNKWKNYKIILRDYPIYVYKRQDTECKKYLEELLLEVPEAKIEILDAPQFEISSSFIRKSISENKDVRFFLDPEVWEYINKMNFYK